MILRTLGNLTPSDLALIQQYGPPTGSGSTAQALFDQWVYQFENYRENGNRRWVNGQWVQSDTPPPPPVYGAAGANPLYAAITGGGNASVPYTPGQYTVSTGGEFNPPPGWGTGTEIAPAGYVPPSSELTDADLRRAAANPGWASLAKGKRLNWHQWNYYRRAYDATLATPAPETVGMGDGSALITATEYHAKLQAAGKGSAAAPTVASTPQTPAPQQKAPQQQQTQQQTQTVTPSPASSVASRILEQPWYVLAGAAAFLLYVMRGSR